MFTVYTYFGRVVSRHKIGANETHHAALKAARKSLAAFERETGRKAWLRLAK